MAEGYRAGRCRLKSVTALHEGEGISRGWARTETGLQWGKQARRQQRGHRMMAGMLLSARGQWTVVPWTRLQNRRETAAETCLKWLILLEVYGDAVLEVMIAEIAVEGG